MTASDSDLRPVVHLDAWTAAHLGRQRETMEDAHRCTPARGIFVLADGMGGHPAGEVASAMAVEAAHHAFAHGSKTFDAYTAAQRAVLSAAKSDPRRFGMGTTLVSATFNGRVATIGWTGDSRAYLYRNGMLLLITEDMGYDNYLAEYIGKPDGAKIGEKTVTIATGDRLLLCTDGLSSYVGEEAIRSCVRDGKSVQKTVAALIEKSLDAGGQDNVTVCMIRAMR